MLSKTVSDADWWENPWGNKQWRGLALAGGRDLARLGFLGKEWGRLTLCRTGSKVLCGSDGEVGAGADCVGDVKSAQHGNGSKRNCERSHFGW